MTKRRVGWRRGTSRWAGRKHYIVHLDATTGPRVEAHCMALGVSKSRWVGELCEEALLKHEVEQRQAAAPRQPWEQPPFWARGEKT